MKYNVYPLPYDSTDRKDFEFVIHGKIGAIQFRLRAMFVVELRNILQQKTTLTVILGRSAVPNQLPCWLKYILFNNLSILFQLLIIYTILYL